MANFVIDNFRVSRAGVEIVHGVSLAIGAGEVHVLVGRNGSGKTSLVNAVMGHPAYTTLGGVIMMDGDDIRTLPPNERARRGLFLSLQQPPEVAGVALNDFLRTAVAATTGEQPKAVAFAASLSEQLAQLRLDPKFAERAVNVGASGGEKKRAEMVQMLALAPKIALLDEPDSGLDADALQYVANAISTLRKEGAGFLIVTHYSQFIELIHPDAIYVMRDGNIVRKGTLAMLSCGIAQLL